MSETAIRVQGLEKTFRHGFWMRSVRAVRGISFDVHAGGIFGFLGPNGAGKTTTIKMLTGLIHPSAGQAWVFGERIPSRKVMQKVGFMPENPYVYPFLTPREFVEMCGQLSGVGRRAVRDRARRTLDLVGILYAADRPARRLSKGMLQRTALAAALVGDPELLILDEPMSGLDPVGRKEVRDLILDERGQGRTIFFSTHILPDVETMCDRVAILNRGKVVVSGELSELLRGSARRTDVHVLDASEEFQRACEADGHSTRRIRQRLVIEVEGERKVDGVVRRALDAGLAVAEVTPRSETLEDLFVREALDASTSAAPPAPDTTEPGDVE